MEFFTTHDRKLVVECAYVGVCAYVVCVYIVYMCVSIVCVYMHVWNFLCQMIIGTWLFVNFRSVIKKLGY